MVAIFANQKFRNRNFVDDLQITIFDMYYYVHVYIHCNSPSDLCIPMNSTKFVLNVSEQLAIKESHLTLEVCIT